MDQAIKNSFIAKGWDGHSAVLLVRGDQQTIELFKDGESVSRMWPVSTGLAGFGNQDGSGCTPTGLHYISACIGADAPLGAVFKGRKPTGEVVQSLPDSATGDYITSRILRLAGLEEGVNLGGDVDSESRYIYIHGTPYHGQLGQPVSAGCVRMANRDIIDLFELVSVDTMVLILT
ncbi:MAG: L,D-transpeptidase [Magnetococcales bacterium]|nr:L,D-transpeptidase [Magnetococcales bacterium]